MLEYKVLKELLDEQKKTNALLEQLIQKGEKEHGRTITKQSDVPESKGTIQRQRKSNRNVR